MTVIITNSLIFVFIVLSLERHVHSYESSSACRKHTIIRINLNDPVNELNFSSHCAKMCA